MAACATGRSVGLEAEQAVRIQNGVGDFRMTVEYPAQCRRYRLAYLLAQAGPVFQHDQDATVGTHLFRAGRDPQLDAVAADPAEEQPFYR